MATAKFAGKCQCGREVPQGANVTFERVGGRYTITACAGCAPDRLSAAHASETALLRVKVQRVKFSKPDGSWGVVEALLVPADAPAGPREPGETTSSGQPASAASAMPVQAGKAFTVAGKVGVVGIGDVLDVAGNWTKDPKWGWQFSATRAVPVVAGTDQALRAFLARFLQVGAYRAAEMLRKLGGREGVLEALRSNPTALTAVAGITESRAQAIAEEYKSSIDLHESALFLAGLDIGEAATAQILDEWGAEAKAIITEDPYELMRLSGFGFKRADDVAQRLAVPKDDPRRLAAAVLHLIEQAEARGHVWHSEDDLMSLTT